MEQIEKEQDPFEGLEPFGQEAASPAEAAEAAGLYYVEDGEPGYRRRRQGRGFIYLDPEGGRVTEAELLQRFASLVIPPAWTEVWICTDERGHIQATGRDAKGRKQYRYHPDWDARSNLAKFNRMISFGDSLPFIRSRVDKDLGRPRLDRQRVVALVIRLLEETLIRIGNPEYERTNNSYGLTTLLDDHIEVRGSRVSFGFVGKSGKQHEIGIQNRRLANLVKRCQELPGQRLFQYLDEEGVCCQSVTSGDVNNYLRETTGQEFTAKDFRTWGGAVAAAGELHQLGRPTDEKQAEKQIVQVVKQVAAALGNTPATCRKYYIHPGVLLAYQDGSLFDAFEEARQRHDADAWLTQDETALSLLLKKRAAAGLDILDEAA